MRITHVICTASFAGVESHVASLAAAQHDLGHTVMVLGGDLAAMRAAIDRPDVEIRPVDGVLGAVRQLLGVAGTRADVVATHMSAADLAALACPTLWRTPVVSTRHFAARRGGGPVRRAVLRLLARRLDAQIAVSAHIAGLIDEEATVVLPGLPEFPEGPSAAERSNVVLLVQRLEAEKETDVGIRAFAASGLHREGWSLHLVGDGAQRPRLERLATQLGVSDSVTFLGHRNDVDALMADAGMLLATCPVEGLGLAVLEAMATRLPVVASAAGGHLETVGSTDLPALFPAGDVAAAAHLLTDLARDRARREAYGMALRDRQLEAFSIGGQARATQLVYEHVFAGHRPPPPAVGRQLVVISLEPWDEVWRRNQHLVTGLMRADPHLRVLFVEPPRDLLQAIRWRVWPLWGRGLRPGPALPGVESDALWLHEPTKPWPRRVDPTYDRRWADGVARAAALSGLTDPTLWVNDPHGAEVLSLTNWPALYDITDDWLLADRDENTHARLVRYEDELMQRCIEVVVCSTGLVRTKSSRREVTLVRNAVDVEDIRRPRSRPADLPKGPVAIYVGTQHSDRLDIELCISTAEALQGTGTLVLVGPNALDPGDTGRLVAAGVMLLGARPSSEVPAYLQHADVLVVPHVIDDFTESLDPIKLYEYLAVGRVVVSTPVSGFREVVDERRRVVTVEEFPSAVLAGLPARDAFPIGADPGVPTWSDRVREMGVVLSRVERTKTGADSQDVPLEARARLGHAAVHELAAAHGVDLLHIKGAALADDLTHPGRRSTDVDVLVRPDHVDRLLDAVTEAGFLIASRFRTGSPFEHATTLTHPVWGHLDVHRLFPGIGLDPGPAFDRLWARRASREIGGVRCSVPDPTDHAVLLVLHAARSPVGGQASADVEQVWHRASEEARTELRARAFALDAEAAFAIGTDPAEVRHRPVDQREEDWLVLTSGPGRLPEWRTRIRTAPDLGARLRLIAMLPAVNTDQLAARLGRRPTVLEITRAFIDRGARGLREIATRARSR